MEQIDKSGTLLSIYRFMVKDNFNSAKGSELSQRIGSARGREVEEKVRRVPISHSLR